MNVIVFGDGPMGRAIGTALADPGVSAPFVVGRPATGGHDPSRLPPADVVFDASRSSAVAPNITAGLLAGCRRFVIATTGWETDRTWVEHILLEHDASAVVAPNLSVGVALFGRLVETAVDLFGRLEAFDPFVVEWHRRGKADRPSGTARDLAARILAGHPRKTRLADARQDGPPAPDELDVAVVRAGSSPGMHLVGFDAPGETVELRLTARDRSAYAAGAVLAAQWLVAEPRLPGIHGFDEVVADLLASGTARLAGEPAAV